MTAVQTETARYPFLARPPQKKQPARDLPSPPLVAAIPLSNSIPPNFPIRRRASGIAAWAALVQPGSPAPRSPHRRLSNSSSRRPSLTRRRPSISHSRSPSGYLGGLVHSPTPSQDIDISLSALGYTSVFVHVPPKTPSTPSHLARSAMKNPFTPTTAVLQPPSPKKPSTTIRTVKRFRSLGILRPRSKSAAVPLPSPANLTSSTSTRARAELIAKRKKAKYAHARPPPPMANEIALMQFADGGYVESNVRRLMEEKARAGDGVGVGGVYRDGKGGMWMDQDEEIEYAHLLDGGDDSEVQWIKFGSDKMDENNCSGSPKTGIVDLAKRESLSTQDSDLSPRYLVLPAEETQCGPEDVVLSFSVSHKSPFRKHSGNNATAGLSILSLPSRPRRAAKHLRKPEFLIDLAAFGPRSPSAQIRISPKSSVFPSSASSPILPVSPHPNTTTATNTCRIPRPRTPKSARFSSAFVQLPPAPGSTNGGKVEKVKRRPAPLKLAPTAASNVGWKRTEASRTPQDAASRTVSTVSTGVIAEARREFVDASFAPRPVFHRVPAAPTPAPQPIDIRNTTSMEGRGPQRGKIVIASLDPMDNMTKCREWAAASGMMTDFEGDVQTMIDVSVNRSSERVAKKKRLGFGGLFGRK